MEYSTPDIRIPDSIGARLVQVIPDVVGRFNYKGERLSFRFSALITTISGTDTTNTISYSFGLGGSFSGIYELSPKDNLHFSVTSTSTASRFMDIFSGKNEDIAYNPNDQKFYGLIASGGFVAWSRNWPKNFSSSISAGMGVITNRDFQTDDDYSHSYNILLNIFWQPVDGARLGVEYASGRRYNKGGDQGHANRLSLLMYYDF